MNRSRPRVLSAAELQDWHFVAASVTRRLPGSVLQPEPPRPERSVPSAPPGLAEPAPAPRRAKGTLAPAAEVERAARRKLASGKASIAARLDLHGFRQAEAHGRLVAFLLDAHRQGRRFVLVITGKGRAEPDGNWGSERGVLRRMVPLWLASPRLAPIVAAYGQAARDHGGEGALYIQLRNPRRRPD